MYLLDDLLKAANLARSVFYYQLKQLAKTDKHQPVIIDAIKEIYHTHKGRYGYRRITLALKQQGYDINHKKVQRLMRQLGLQAIIRRRRKYTSYHGQVGKIADNVLGRNFKTDKPNHKWATDVTEFRLDIMDKTDTGATKSQKLYLSPIIDLYNGEIISYQMSTRPSYRFVGEMLDQALERLKAESSQQSGSDSNDNDNNEQQLIIHSDQGWHYQMQKYQQTLKDNSIIQSMSRKGNCLDNAVIESFFGTLKEEMFYHDKFSSINELKTAIDEYIHYYNHDRIKIKLKGLSPVVYRTKSLN